jgi:hypothetical protein
VDYFTPQLYWPIGKTDQAYAVLLRWWGEQSDKGRHLWPGLFTSRVTAATPAGNGLSPSNPWVASEIVAQVDSTRANPQATGTVHFSMKAFMTDQGGVASALASQAYGDVALVPASPWMAKATPAKPVVKVRRNAGTGGLTFTVAMPARQTARWYMVQARTGGVWRSTVTAACTCAQEIVPNGEGLLPDRLVVTAVDRVGQAAPAVSMVVR